MQVPEHLPILAHHLLLLSKEIQHGYVSSVKNLPTRMNWETFLAHTMFPRMEFPRVMLEERERILETSFNQTLEKIISLQRRTVKKFGSIKTVSVGRVESIFWETP
jgi:hypothetical protein